MGCGSWGVRICTACRAGLRPGPERTVAETTVRSAFEHTGTGRTLIHALKYRGVVSVVDVLAPAMAGLIPPTARALVPIPRAHQRRLRYGIDPAWELARAVGKATGVEVVSALAPPVFSRPHAGGSRSSRRVPIFRVVSETPFPAVLIDDVVTTGSTIVGALLALGRIQGAVTATSAVTSLVGGVHP